LLHASPSLRVRGSALSEKAADKKTKTPELTLTVTGTADGEWRAGLQQGTTYLVRKLAVAAAAVSRAPIDEVIEEVRSQQAARVAALCAATRNSTKSRKR